MAGFLNCRSSLEEEETKIKDEDRSLVHESVTDEEIEESSPAGRESRSHTSMRASGARPCIWRMNFIKE